MLKSENLKAPKHGVYALMVLLPLLLLLTATGIASQGERTLVAGAGLEPATFGIWTQRATTAPPRRL